MCVLRVCVILIQGSLKSLTIQFHLILPDSAKDPSPLQRQQLGLWDARSVLGSPQLGGEGSWETCRGRKGSRCGLTRQQMRVITGGPCLGVISPLLSQPQGLTRRGRPPTLPRSTRAAGAHKKPRSPGKTPRKLRS